MVIKLRLDSEKTRVREKVREKNKVLDSFLIKIKSCNIERFTSQSKSNENHYVLFHIILFT